MAGEWLKWDVETPRKPEVLELLDLTGLERATVVGRLVMCWGYYQIHSCDGTLRISPRLLAAECGGDEEFWRMVQAVGWLRIDEDTGVIEILGWEKRFSQAAKERAAHAERARAQRQRTPTVRPSARDSAPERTEQCAPAHQRRGEEKRSEENRRENRGEGEERGPAGAAGDPSPPSPPPILEKFWGNLRQAGVPLPQEAPGWLLAALDGPGGHDMLTASVELQTSFFVAKGEPPGLANFRNATWVGRLAAGEFRDQAAKPPPRTHENGRYWRKEFGRNMTDAEFRAHIERSRQAIAGRIGEVK